MEVKPERRWRLGRRPSLTLMSITSIAMICFAVAMLYFATAVGTSESSVPYAMLISVLAVALSLAAFYKSGETKIKKISLAVTTVAFFSLLFWTYTYIF
jgi:hypothetical protein